MVRAAALVFLASLSACTPAPVRDQEARQQVDEDHAAIAAMQATITNQGEQINAVRAATEAATITAESVEEKNRSLTKTFNQNVDQENEHLRKVRTAAGVCGEEQVWSKDGTYIIRNKDCPAPEPDTHK
jgi:predicted ArsR family transcriptional regulator